MSRRSVRERVKWTEVMISDLRSCKEESKSAVNSDNPPRHANGRKIGYMQLMLKLWNEKGYQDLGLTAQNLSDRARKDECKQTDLLTPISQTVDEDRINNVSDDNVTINTNSNLINGAESINNVVENVSSDLLDDEISAKLLTKSECIFNNISATKGDFSKRNYTTKFRKTPCANDINYINNTCKQLIRKKQIESMPDMVKVFWFISCIIYSSVAGWIIFNDVKNMEINKVVIKRDIRVPSCVLRVEREIKEVRAQISKCCAELNRLMNNGRLTRKMRRNRVEISKQCDGVISCYNLTCYIERLKKRLKYLSKKRTRKLRSEKARSLNNEFKNDQGKVFDKFRETIDQDPDNTKPVYEEKLRTTRYFECPDEVETFWSQLWESPDKGNPDTTWLNDFEKKFSEIVENVDEGDLDVNYDICYNAIKKKKNWTSPGPDRIVNFWLKKLPCIIEVCVKLYFNTINILQSIEPWICQGRVALIPKEGEWSASNQRPITCLNTLYKWLTSILLIFHNKHVNKYQLLQIDQRGSKQGCAGTVNNLLIDDSVMRDAVLHHRNLFCFWIDVRKAFDSVSHSWLIKMLEIHRFPRKLVTIFISIMKSWSVYIQIPVKDGYKQSRVIQLINGILQGDTYCPQLYGLSVNVIAWVIRSTEGYTLSKPISLKVTHTLFVDDLKGYAKSFDRLKFILNLIRNHMEDAGLLWNPKKCKFIAFKRGKHCVYDDITLDNGNAIKCLKEGEYYEFLGVPQHTKMDAETLGNELLNTIQKRSHIVWSSHLSDINKCRASNTFINSAAEYYFWTVKFTLEMVREMDITIRKSMNINGAKHTNQMNEIMYLQRNKGGRGLRSLEVTYKMTKIKLAAKLINDKDRRLEIVRQFHKRNIETASYSIFKDAKRYGEEFDIQLEVKGDNLVIINQDNDLVVENMKMISSKLTSNNDQKAYAVVLNSTWQGLNLKQRVDDEDVVKKYFQWLQRWQLCPTDVVQEFSLMFYQLLPTRCYKKSRSNEQIEDIRCRLCNSEQESVKHIMSHCGDLVNSLFTTRHDNALKCFVWPMLKQFGLVEKVPCWYANDKVKPHYSSNDFDFWWDIPEYTGKDTESKRPPRPDGKLRYVNETEKKLFLIEMTVPWTTNRKDKFEFKDGKYVHIQQSLKFENPDYHVDQITLVMDVFGGYGRDLVDNIRKVVTDSNTVQSIITNMQKSVIASVANLSRTFKIRCK